MSRIIQYIVLHCTAGPKHQSTEDIQKYWRETLGWNNPGYHYLINYDGSVDELSPEYKITNGVKGYNANAIHISYKGGVVGGRPTDTRSEAQKEAMFSLLKDMKVRYPMAEILGHRDFPGVTKACPSFDVKDWIKQVNL